MSSQLGKAQLGGLQLGGLEAGPPPDDSIRPSGIASGEAWGTAELISNAIYPTSIGSGEAWGTPSVEQRGIRPAGIVSGEAWGTPEIADFNIRVVGIVSGETWGTPAITDRDVRVLGGIPGEEAWGTPALLGGDMSEMVVANKPFAWVESTLRISKSLNQPNKCTCDFIYRGGPKPKIGQFVRFYWDGELRFGGMVLELSETNIPGNFNKSRISLTMIGFQALTDRCIIHKLYTLSLGGLPGIIIYDIWANRLSPMFGMTKFSNSDEGANVVTGEMLFHYITATEALNQLVDKEPGWNWWVDDYNSLHHENTLGKGPDAPFSITDGTKQVDKMTVVTTAKKRRNRQFILPSIDLAGFAEEFHEGDGFSTAFPTDYPLNEAPLVSVDGIRKNVTVLGVWPDPWEVYWIPGGIGVFFRTPPANGADIDVRYPSPFPIAFMRENTEDIDLNGQWESAFQSKTIKTQADAETAAQGLVDMYSNPVGSPDDFPDQVKYEYNSEHEPAWLTPGMVVPINRTFPDVSGNYIVETVDSSEQELTVFRHSVTLRRQGGDMDDARFVDDMLVASRAQIAGQTIPATLELDINGFGLQVTTENFGILPDRFIFQKDCVIAYWDAMFAIDPPTGSSVIIDCRLNGGSIFGANKIEVPDGVSALVTGYEFGSANIACKKGDILTFSVQQVGSTFPGRYGVVHIVAKG